MAASGDWRRRYRIARRRVGGALLPALGPTTLRALSRTWTHRVHGIEHLEEAEASTGHLMALWHGRMLVGIPYHRGRSYTVLVSPSDDGALVCALLDRFGYRAVRGSTSRGGGRALRTLVDSLERGGTIVITPDGPRGPRHSMNAGLAWMARETGFPIVPCGFVCDRAWRLNSWDRFTIPRPGARVEIRYGEPILVPAGGGDRELEEATEEVRSRLMEIELAGFESLDVEPDW